MEKKSFSPGNIVLSLKGRDSGKKYMIIEIVNPDFALIADGSCRKLSNPKLKRIKHFKFLAAGEAGSEEFFKQCDDGAVINILRKFEGR